jgi:hypothetical protein
MYTQIEDSNDSHALTITAHSCPVGSGDIATTFSIKVIEHDYVTRYCSISITVDNADDTVAGVTFAAAYAAHMAFKQRDYQHVLLNPHDPNTLLAYLLHKMPHGNASYNKVSDTHVKTWCDYAKPSTKLTPEANARIDELMEQELTDEPIGKTHDDLDEMKDCLRQLADKHGVELSEEDMIPDSGHDGLYA